MIKNFTIVLLVLFSSQLLAQEPISPLNHSPVMKIIDVETSQELQSTEKNDKKDYQINFKSGKLLIKSEEELLTI